MEGKREKDRAGEKSGKDDFLSDSVDKDDFFQGLQNADPGHDPDKEFSLSFDHQQDAAHEVQPEAVPEPQPEAQPSAHSGHSSSHDNDLNRAVVMEEGEGEGTQHHGESGALDFAKELDAQNDSKNSGSKRDEHGHPQKQNSLFRQKGANAPEEVIMEKGKHPEKSPGSSQLTSQGRLQDIPSHQEVHADNNDGRQPHSNRLELVDEPHGVRTECCVACRLV